MKINLDKFKTEFEVELDKKTYSVRGVTMAEMINDNPLDLLENAKGNQETMKAMVKIVSKLSNIPAEIIEEQQTSVVTAIFQLTQGIMPDEKEEQKKS